MALRLRGNSHYLNIKTQTRAHMDMNHFPAVGDQTVAPLSACTWTAPATAKRLGHWSLSDPLAAPHFFRPLLHSLVLSCPVITSGCVTRLVVSPQKLTVFAQTSQTAAASFFLTTEKVPRSTLFAISCGINQISFMIKKKDTFTQIIRSSYRSVNVIIDLRPGVGCIDISVSICTPLLRNQDSSAMRAFPSSVPHKTGQCWPGERDVYRGTRLPLLPPQNVNTTPPIHLLISEKQWTY